MKIYETSFIHKMDMTTRERVQHAENELARAIERERIRACAAASMDDMIREMVFSLRQILPMTSLGLPAKKRLTGIILRAEKDRLHIADGGEYACRYKFDTEDD
jgi:hypothetical protein